MNGHQLELTEAVICQHAALAGLPQGTAEEYYILAAQQLEGYGLEMFTAKVRITYAYISNVAVKYVHTEILQLFFNNNSHFSLQDNSSNEVTIGISLTGITVKNEILQCTKFFK